jgi:hypothetical protein
MTVLAREEPISPELALVCPELAQRARELLPERDPNGFVPGRAARSAARFGPKTWLVASVYAVVSMVIVVANGVAIGALIVMALTLAADWNA